MARYKPGCAPLSVEPSGKEEVNMPYNVVRKCLYTEEGTKRGSHGHIGRADAERKDGIGQAGGTIGTLLKRLPLPLFVVGLPSPAHLLPALAGTSMFKPEPVDTTRTVKLQKEGSECASRAVTLGPPSSSTMVVGTDVPFQAHPVQAQTIAAASYVAGGRGESPPTHSGQCPVQGQSTPNGDTGAVAC